MEACVLKNLFLRCDLTFPVRMVIKLPISVRDRHLLLARFSKNQVYLQNLSAMSMGSVIVLPLDLNDEGRDGLFLCLFITSFSSFHVVQKSFLASSSSES